VSKTSKKTQETKQTADPALVKDYGNLTGVAQFLASLGFQPNRAVTVAGMTPAQEASFASTQNAAAAFGMPVATSTGAPAPTMSAGGIMGYSTAPGYDEAVSKLPAGYADAIANIFKMLQNAAGSSSAAGGERQTDVPSTKRESSEPGTTGALNRFTAADRRARAENETVGQGLKDLGSSIMGSLRSMVSGKSSTPGSSRPTSRSSAKR
jgi:hypothetical protein